MYTIETPRGEKPFYRERATAHGIDTLSDQELLALILGSGNRKKSVIDLSNEILGKIQQIQKNAKETALREIPGIGVAQACRVLAVFELGRRFYGSQSVRIGAAGDVYPLVRHYASLKQEQFLCLSLNGAHEVLAIRVVTIGLLNRTMVHPREVFADPLADRAAAIIICHNHPSGLLEPSEEDRSITRRIHEAGTLLGIPLLDHLIISPKGFFSFADSGGFFG
ncbi:MAG TPA: DNA repair protein RadC [Treponemataceae bacterium]|jgi:DNA repair protein RadC|nr:DNA repair protein RadC [Treponemataceae bacterium]